MFKRYASLLLAMCVPALIAVLAPVSALAVMQSPQWTVTAFSAPTNFASTAGSTGVYRVHVQNTGEAPSSGTITVTDVLPAGLSTIVSEPPSGVDSQADASMSCVGLTCTYSGVVAIDDTLEIAIPVEVQAGAPPTVTNRVTVSGGGASEASRETATAISSTPASFGIAPGSAATVLSNTQAGGHPDVTTTFQFDTMTESLLAGNPRESGAVLPPGFVGDLADTPKCPIARFSEAGEANNPPLRCSLGTVVGTVSLYLSYGPIDTHLILPLMNLTTNPGEIAKLGFSFGGYGIQGTVSLAPSDYGIRVNFETIPDNANQFAGASLTVWGVPSAHIHDLMRGRSCVGGSFGREISGVGCAYVNETRGTGNSGETPIELSEEPEGQSVTELPIPYLTSPTQCTSEPMQATIEVNSWEEPGREITVPSDIGPLTGCSLLEFAPAITASPDTTRADTPAGFTFGVHMGQEGLVNPAANSQADIEDTTVTLPEGIAINPGQANGLGACQFSQAAIGVGGPPSCPSNSKVGQVAIETPILRNKLEGNVYVLQSNPPDVKLLVAPEDPPDGIYVKFVGDVHLNETTGQLTTTFEKTPQLPFDSLKLSFSGGAQAALATPTGCGTYTTNTDFTPWSTPFVADAFPSSGFAIETGPGGSACASPLPFAPELIAGATTDQAGGFTNFSLLLQRADGQQRVSTLQFKVPEGLLGMISKVPLCGEPQASEGTCSSASQIGHTVVEAGPGPYPLVVPQPGQPPAPIYLTGGYKGAPYGLSIVVPLHVGPFTLQTQVVRAKIEVNPLTAQLTVTTDPLPQIIDGVPADLRAINAVIDRPGFMFNPTSCSPASFGGTATSIEGTAAAISSHFQVGSCQSLKFQPNFKVSTSGQTSKANGASLNAKIVYPSGALPNNQASSQSNIKSVKVDLPKQLPSRLTTLQKACTAAQFEVNPAGCPVASIVGHAKAVTPVLPVPLEGPAYFVSHGGEAFPSLIVVLQGYGTTVDLVGTTFISKAGITSSTFKNVPDVPVGSFELNLPEGKFSALTTNGNLCSPTRTVLVKRKVTVRVRGHRKTVTRKVRETQPALLAMPTEFVGQNGAVIHQTTKIAVTGCPKKKAKKASSHRRKGKARKR